VHPLSLLITLPLALVLVIFALNNRSLIEIDLWPLGFVIAWPAFVFAFVGVSVGLLLGGLLAWISGGATRKLARERKARIRELEHTVATMKTRFDDTSAAQPRPPALPE